MVSFVKLKRCLDISERDIEASMESREATRNLLDAASAVSRPADGAFRVLAVFAQMAKGSCDWLDGELRVELAEADDVTVIECMTDRSGGYRERVFPPIVIHAPIEEFRAAVAQEYIAPLVVKTSRGRRIALVAEPEAGAPSMAAHAVAIGRESLVGTSEDARRETGGGARRGPRDPFVGTCRIPPVPMPSFTEHEAPLVNARARGGVSASETPEAIAHAKIARPGTMIPSGLGAPPPPPIVRANDAKNAQAPLIEVADARHEPDALFAPQGQPASSALEPR
jgi:hypothetical protein